MKFAHLADCHIGGWSDHRMKQLGLEAFEKAVKHCIDSKVDFILISGDLFNTALPQIELIRDTVSVLKTAKDSQTPVFIIPGSHDFSPSGKTMLEVLEKAGLCKNVAKGQFTKCKDAKITGMMGRKGGLEKDDYKTLDISTLEKEDGFKIFMFHTALDELKPAEMAAMESMAMALLPKDFHYYAGGHVHALLEKEYGKGMVVYPGALFPNNFRELEQNRHGGFFIVETDGTNIKKEYVPVNVKDVIALNVDAEGKSAMQLNEELLEKASGIDAKDKLVLMRIAGTLSSGKPSDINFKDIFARLDEPYFVMKNTSKLASTQFEKTIDIQTDDIESGLIAESCGKSSIFDADTEKQLVNSLIATLDKEKTEGEKTADFENRVMADAVKTLEISEHLS